MPRNTNLALPRHIGREKATVLVDMCLSKVPLFKLPNVERIPTPLFSNKLDL